MSIFRKILKKIKVLVRKQLLNNQTNFSTSLELPEGWSEAELLKYLKSFKLDDGDSSELVNYLQEDFRRFLYTLNLVPNTQEDSTKLKLLEIGSNPYFTSVLIKKFLHHETYFTNFFGEKYNGPLTQVMKSNEYNEEYRFEFVNQNIEEEEIPLKEKFDVVLFCEVLEHCTGDPMAALLRIKDSLVKDGTLILTTPNVNRFENVARMLSGNNIYDPYSGYGPYGRHNREYNKHELSVLLDHLGFDIEVLYSSDVHENRSHHFFNTNKFSKLVDFRKDDLGQYLFVKAKNTREANRCKPNWLYRSYSEAEMC